MAVKHTARTAAYDHTLDTGYFRGSFCHRVEISSVLYGEVQEVLLGLSQQSIWLYEHAGLSRARMRHCAAAAAPCSDALFDDSAQTAVDLSLATTYVPGVRALVETLVLLTVVQLFLAADVASHSQVVTVAAAVLYTVRSLWHCRIVDSSGCAIVVLVALTVNTWRVELEDGQILVHHSVDLAWMLVSLAILLHDVVPMPFLHTQVWMHTIVTAVFLAMHAFMALAFEDNFTQYLRSAGFVLLSVFWTYTSYLKVTPGSVTLNDCLHRFVLMLLAEWYIALLFLDTVNGWPVVSRDGVPAWIQTSHNVQARCVTLERQWRAGNYNGM